MDKDSVIVLVIGVIMAMVWYVMWVQPRDDFNHSVLECMEDMSEESYNRCTEKVRATRVSPKI